MEMKEYTAPKMTVVQLDIQNNLLVDSTGSSDGPNVDEYEGEFGFNFDVENKKNA